MRFNCTNSPVFTVGRWQDTETDSTFYDLYVNGKFHTRHVDLRSLLNEIACVIIGGNHAD